MILRPFAAVVLVLPLLAGALPASGQQRDERPLRTPTTAEDLMMFSQVLNHIRVNHPDSLDTHRLLLAAVEGMVRAADPHSYLLPAYRLPPSREESWRRGELEPVPIRFRFIGGAPVVAGVDAGSRAAAIDIVPGDELVEADGRPLQSLSEVELDIELAGREGSEVTLVFERRRSDGSLVRITRAVRRERGAGSAPVPVATFLDDSTGYVRITTFAGERVAAELRAALDRLERQGMRRLLLDLRDNGGGLLGEAAHVAGEFLPEGALVYTTRGRKAEMTDTARVERSFWERGRSYSMVLLVNEGTASASEVLAGALQDHDRALVVGRHTFGKALLMRPLPLNDGSVLVLVMGETHTPCGRSIQREYRTISRRDYYRTGASDRDTLGLPTCRTLGGRVLYGGGGIRPDVTLEAPPPPPAWLDRVRENQLALRWLAGFEERWGGSVPDRESFLGSPSIPTDAVEDLLMFVARNGVEVPPGAEASAQLEEEFVRLLAFHRWGAAGLHEVGLRNDPEVRAAVSAMQRAGALLEGTR